MCGDNDHKDSQTDDRDRQMPDGECEMLKARRQMFHARGPVRRIGRDGVAFQCNGLA